MIADARTDGNYGMAFDSDGRVGSFSEIAAHEGKVERHIRLLTLLAFVSPRIISAIMDGSAPADLR